MNDTPVRHGRFLTTDKWFSKKNCYGQPQQYAGYAGNSGLAQLNEAYPLDDPLDLIKEDSRAVQDTDSGSETYGQWYLPKGTTIVCWQPTDAIDGHWEPLPLTGSASIWRYVSGTSGPIYAYSDDSTPDPVLVGRKTDDGSGAILQVDGTQFFTGNIIIGTDLTSYPNVIIGEGTFAGNGNVGIGANTTTSNGSLAFGANTTATGGSTALGLGSVSTGGYSVAIGSSFGATATASYQFSFVAGYGVADYADANGQGGVFIGGFNSNSTYVPEAWLSILTDMYGAQGGIAQVFGRLIVDNTAYPYAADNGNDNLQVVGSQGTGGYGIYCPQYVTEATVGDTTGRTPGITATDIIGTQFAGGIAVALNPPGQLYSGGSDGWYFFINGLAYSSTATSDEAVNVRAAPSPQPKPAITYGTQANILKII